MKKNMAGLILVLFAIALFMTGCEKKAQEKEEAQEASARQLVIQKQTQTEIAEKKIEEKRRELPNQAQIEMEVILQKPELPTGCESVALTMVLKQKGYPIEKTTIAEEYLIYNRDNSLHVWWGWHLSARTCKYSKPLFETAISAAYSV